VNDEVPLRWRPGLFRGRSLSSMRLRPPRLRLQFLFQTCCPVLRSELVARLWQRPRNPDPINDLPLPSSVREREELVAPRWLLSSLVSAGS